jgi:hypothetical protein
MIAVRGLAGSHQLLLSALGRVLQIPTSSRKSSLDLLHLSLSYRGLSHQ